jgi:hypothetical protein
MYFFDISILSNLLSPDIVWKVVYWIYNKIVKGEPLKSSPGNQVFIWGSNRFIGCPNVLVVGNKPTIKIETLGNRLYLSADFYDRTGRLMMKIVRNKVKLNKNNIFKIEEWQKDKLKIINQYDEPIEIICHKTGEIELNGVFYCGRNRFEASPAGLQVN